VTTDVTTTATASGTGSSTASPDEIAKFSRLADAWWDPTGAFKPLHKFNPERIRFIRDRLAQHFGRDTAKDGPFAGLRLLDIGCGGGLISEPMARLGFEVTGVDASEENIQTARTHAARSGLAITYRAGTPEELTDLDAFDAVLALEVVEHVVDMAAFVEATAALVKPGGVLILATLNRTAKGFLLGKIAAEYVLRWVPAGTHDWRKFVRPSELASAVRQAGLQVNEITGLSFDIVTDSWRTSRDLDVNYMMMAVKP
jgi:2-polyprenyl-6-hydroxyphenyl methylase/3-demethylubiquinone-9 3-methyltransferase